MDRTVRDVKGVAMPLEDLFGAGEVAEQRVMLPLGCGLHVVPADFLDRVGPHVGTERTCQQLRAQANAEHRFAGGDRLTNRGHFHGKVRVMVYLVAVHRAAEHDQAMIAAEVGYGIRLAAEVLVTNAKAGIAQQGVERAEYFVRDVLEYKQPMDG